MTIKHGTITGYTWHLCRCAACREVNRVYCASAKAKRIARGVPDDRHGTADGYVNYSCRCDPCVEAGARNNREYARRNRERINAYRREQYRLRKVK